MVFLREAMFEITFICGSIFGKSVPSENEKTKQGELEKVISMICKIRSRLLVMQRFEISSAQITDY